jgi:transcriptional regulator with XRE-family HTH domain
MAGKNTRAIERKLDRIRSLGPEQLRLEWRRLYHSDAPRISRDLLVLGLGYRLQEIEQGGLGKWRRKLKYSQFEAAAMLGLSRAAIQHWETERHPISNVIELACEELTRRWKQRPEFGPVTLIYADDPVWSCADHSTRSLFVQCELYSNNEAAHQRACWLKATRKLVNPLIVAEDGEIVWAAPELLRECERRSEKAKGISDGPDSAPDPSGDPSAN